MGNAVSVIISCRWETTG